MSFCKNGGPGGSARRPVESFFHKTQSCWIWTGASVNSRGPRYGTYRLSNGKAKKAHRMIYESLKGLIPVGLELDHLCRNTLCVNPEHLEPVTHKVNVQRGHRWSFQTTI